VLRLGEVLLLVARQMLGPLWQEPDDAGAYPDDAPNKLVG